ncbi:MAG: FAD binding domain-containing protein [Burkholderiales bacterium]
MEFHSPTTIDDACRLLTASDARALAGGQSLVAMMNLGLAAPERLVSLRRIDGLAGIQNLPDGGVRIGAMTTHADLAALTPRAAGPRLVALAARVVAYPAVRNVGTVGGAVALADPSADYPCALVAADASIEIASVSGTRMVAAADFFRGMFETALRAGELVSAIHVPPGPANAGAHYEKFSLVAGDYAIVSVAAIVAADAMHCRAAQLAVGACGPRPVRSLAAEASLRAGRLDDAAIAAAGVAIANACSPSDDSRASAAYRRRIVPALVRRAIAGASLV